MGNALNTEFYEGFEGEGLVEIENGEDGFDIWEGYFNTILEGCYYTEFSPNGIIECYANQDGFFDEKWEMEFPHVVIDELKRFDENSLDTSDEDMINQCRAAIEKILEFISKSISLGKKIYIEYN